jgi:ketosteroid isomerase-like protein
VEDAVELVRTGLEAYARGDHESALSGFHPDIDWVVGEDLVPEGGRYRGHDGVREFWAGWAVVFEGFSLEIVSVEQLEDGRVLAVTRASGTGAGSGVPVRSPEFTQLFEVEDGQVVRVTLRSTRG